MRATSFTAACVEPAMSARRLSSSLGCLILRNTVSDRAMGEAPNKKVDLFEPQRRVRLCTVVHYYRRTGVLELRFAPGGDPTEYSY